MQSPAVGSLEAAFARTRHLMRSDPRMAAEQAREILKAVPGHPRARLLLGVALRSSGLVTAAIETLSSLVQTEPASAAAHFELGAALDEAGRSESALAALNRAAELRPDMPDVWRVIGDHLSARGDAPGADAAYARHLKASVKDEGTTMPRICWSDASSSPRVSEGPGTPMRSCCTSKTSRGRRCRKSNG